MQIYCLFIAVGLFSTVLHAKYANPDFPQGTIKQQPSRTGDVGNTDEEGNDDGDYADFEDYGDYEYLDAYFGPGNEHLLMPSENETYNETMYEDPDDYTFDADLHTSIEDQTGDNELVDLPSDESLNEDNSVEINRLQDADVDGESERNRVVRLSQDINVMDAERYKRRVNNRRSKLQPQTSTSLEEKNTTSIDAEAEPQNSQPSPPHYTDWSAGVVPEPSERKNYLDDRKDYGYIDYDHGENTNQSNRKTLGRKPNTKPKPNISKNRVPPRRVTDRSRLVGSRNPRLPHRSNKNPGSPPRNKLRQAQPRKSPQNSLVNPRRKTASRVFRRGSPIRQSG